MNLPPDHSHAFLFSDFQVLPQVTISIVIPVKDEEQHILNTLTAFSMQVDSFGSTFNSDQFEILILANNCSDRSVAYIKGFQKRFPRLNIYLEELQLPPNQANIGYVRRLLKEAAYKRLSRNGGGIIMTTDGDTTVAKDWIAETQSEIRAGADAVGGRILLLPEEIKNLDQFTSAVHFKNEKYLMLVAELEAKIIQNSFDPAPTHHQHFNGSFAITTECYAKSGGVPDVCYLEDCAFFERLQNIDAKVRHSNKVIVHTSARYVGRTEIGLSYQLNAWRNLGRMGEDILVESCASINKRLILKRKLKDLWAKRKDLDVNSYEEFKQIVPEFNTNDAAYESFKTTPYFGEWYSNIIEVQGRHCVEKFPDVPIDRAIMDLQTAISDYSSAAFSQTSIR